MSKELVWKDNVPTTLQPGVLIAQGIRRIYCIHSELVGINRFRSGIRRGCFVYWSNLPAEKLEDAKSILQADHDAICEAIAEAIEDSKPKWMNQELATWEGYTFKVIAAPNLHTGPPSPEKEQ